MQVGARPRRVARFYSGGYATSLQELLPAHVTQHVRSWLSISWMCFASKPQTVFVEPRYDEAMTMESSKVAADMPYKCSLFSLLINTHEYILCACTACAAVT